MEASRARRPRWDTHSKERAALSWVWSWIGRWFPCLYNTRKWGLESKKGTVSQLPPGSWIFSIQRCYCALADDDAICIIGIEIRFQFLLQVSPLYRLFNGHGDVKADTEFLYWHRSSNLRRISIWMSSWDIIGRLPKATSSMTSSYMVSRIDSWCNVLMSSPIWFCLLSLRYQSRFHKDSQLTGKRHASCNPLPEVHPNNNTNQVDVHLWVWVDRSLWDPRSGNCQSSHSCSTYSWIIEGWRFSDFLK